MIHNAAFDMKFLNAEFGWCNLPVLPMNLAIDTLTMARQKYPGAPASLDALCRRFGIDNSGRGRSTGRCWTRRSSRRCISS